MSTLARDLRILLNLAETGGSDIVHLPTADLRSIVETIENLRDALEDLFHASGPNVGTPEVEAEWRAAMKRASELLFGPEDEA